MAGRGKQQNLRKYLGAIKDSTTVGLAKVNSDYKELDIAIVRATNHVERPAKEKHIKAALDPELQTVTADILESVVEQHEDLAAAAIFLAVSAARPRADVAYCIHALARRLLKTHNWAVALKTLIVIHRALREVDPTFREELINYGRSRSHMLNLSHFKDDSSANAWDYSAWVRTYALYLEERLECFHVLKYDVETDPPRTRDLETVELLVQLPALQQLLFRLINCQPQGAAVYNFVIQLALSMVVAESKNIYNAISNGTSNMIDKFFEMQRPDALRALEIYRRAGQQAERLSEFYEVCKSIDIGRGEKNNKIEQPPASFLTAMEEYVRASTVRKVEEKASPKVILAIEDKKAPEEQDAPPPSPPPPKPEPVKVAAAPILSEEPDLLGLHDTNPDASELDAKNAFALAIVPVDNPSTTATSIGVSSSNVTTGWELALVTTPSSNDTTAASSKLAGGLDKLTLDSLYDDAIRRANQRTSYYNPWEPTPMFGTMMQQAVMAYDPFYPSNTVAAPHSVQMAVMAQQHQPFLLQQQQQQMMLMMGQQQLHPLNPNPLGNPYAAVSPQTYGLGMPLQSSNAYTGLI